MLRIDLDRPGRRVRSRVSVASAAPFNGYVVGAAVAENGAIQQVQWGTGITIIAGPASPSPLVVTRRRLGS